MLTATNTVVSDEVTVKTVFFAVSVAMLMKPVASQTPPIVHCSDQGLSTHSLTHVLSWSLLVKTHRDSDFWSCVIDRSQW